MRRLLLLTATAVALVGLVLALTTFGPGRSGSTTQSYAVAARGSVEQLQSQLEQQPTDAVSWAALGQAYVEQARITADPSYYAKAEGALARSLELRPIDNDAALAGQAALAAARHDFPAALVAADAALAVNPLSPQALGSRTDALTELGRYDEALAAAEQADSARPSLTTFTRLAYQSELRGDLDAARLLFERALEERPSPDDVAFVRQHLGDIAAVRGDERAAQTEYAAALEAVPDHLPTLAGRARLDAATGDVDRALSTWESVVTRAPLPGYLAEYGELLESVGRTDDATRQYDAVRASNAIAATFGASDRVELALFEADHGDPVAALAAAEAEWAVRQAVHVADAYAWALHVNGRAAEALAMSDRAVALGSVDPLFLRHRAAILAAAGNAS